MSVELRVKENVGLFVIEFRLRLFRFELQNSMQKNLSKEMSIEMTWFYVSILIILIWNMKS